MSTRDAEEEFEFLLNLLASDGVGPDPGQPRGAPGDEPDDDDRGVRVQRGTDGRLDLGQVKAFYESKNMRGGLEETRGPVSTDRPRNNTGKCEEEAGPGPEADISVSRSVSEHEDGRVSPSRDTLAPEPPDTGFAGNIQEHTKASGSSPSVDETWVDLLSEQEAKQLLLEISDALKLKLPADGRDSRSAVDRPRTLAEVKNVAEFLARVDELVWHRSEHGANRRVFDPENVSAVEERVRLWERIARGYCSEQGCRS